MYAKSLTCEADLTSHASQFGAEVIKIEPPGIGDPLRVWREIDVDGTSPWFRSIGRNKKSVAIDLRKPEGRKYARAMIHDILVNQFTIQLGETACH
jgi:crotonobetainyl-CoA:carnitine CoA-transferase CaiB-like acyl-CoA transferase